MKTYTYDSKIIGPNGYKELMVAVLNDKGNPVDSCCYKIDVPQGAENIDDVKEKFFGDLVNIKDHYFGNDWYRASEESTLSWFKTKGISIKGGSWWLLTNQAYIYYFSGKLYGLSKEFFDFFINHNVIEGLCHLMARDWGGCEDMVVGIIYEKFSNDQR